MGGGIATATAAIVAAADGVPVACTRKNVPGAKALSIQAVMAGGGVMHRQGLSETLLVFAEHRLFLSETPAQTIARLRHGQPEKKIVIEVATVDEALIWADAGADVLQLEKFTPEAVAACRLAIPKGSLCPFAPSWPRPAGCGRNTAASVAAGAVFGASAPTPAAPRDAPVTFRLEPRPRLPPTDADRVAGPPSRWRCTVRSPAPLAGQPADRSFAQARRVDRYPGAAARQL